MGDKLTLNKHNLNIQVTHNKATGEWTASWGSYCTQVAFSAASALRLLAEEFESKSLHGSAEEALIQYRKKPDIFCKYCHAPIFFAVLNSGKYLAFDTEPVEGADLGDEDRGAVFPRTAQTLRGPKPLAVFRWGSVAHGPVFIPHPQTCGDNVIAPTTPCLLDRWTRNRTVSAEKRAQVIAGLRNIKADIEQGALNDPHEHEPDLLGFGDDRVKSRE